MDLKTGRCSGKKDHMGTRFKDAPLGAAPNAPARVGAEH
jgi:hypothetical protein